MWEFFMFIHSSMPTAIYDVYELHSLLTLMWYFLSVFSPREGVEGKFLSRKGFGDASLMLGFSREDGESSEEPNLTIHLKS
jgi:hypothetical protein